MKVIRIVFLLLITTWLLNSCSSKSEFDPIYDVPDEFQPIVEKFIQEAVDHGLNLEIDNLIIVYDPDIESTYCGTCNSKDQNSNIQKIISINPKFCWLNDYMKEALIYHELGHCILGRDHENTRLPNDDPKSMMVKDDISVYSPCIYVLGEDTSCNFVFKRAYYIAELFDATTPIPDWAKP